VGGLGLLGGCRVMVVGRRVGRGFGRWCLLRLWWRLFLMVGIRRRVRSLWCVSVGVV
jgi:hypothetical protein